MKPRELEPSSALLDTHGQVAFTLEGLRADPAPLVEAINKLLAT